MKKLELIQYLYKQGLHPLVVYKLVKAVLDSDSNQLFYLRLSAVSNEPEFLVSAPDSDKEFLYNFMGMIRYNTLSI